MQVTSSTRVSGATGNPRKAAILRQIRRLEEKKQELMDKLSGNGESSASSSGQTPGFAKVNHQPVSSEGPGLHSGASGDDGTGDTFAGQGSGVLDLGEVLGGVASGVSSSASFPEVKEEPKEILKRIQLIELQIMTLRQQLGNDAMITLEVVDEKEDTSAADLAASLFSTPGEGMEAGQPAAEVVDGHVDGYA